MHKMKLFSDLPLPGRAMINHEEYREEPYYFGERPASHSHRHVTREGRNK